MSTFFDYQNEQVANLPLHLRKYMGKIDLIL